MNTNKWIFAAALVSSLGVAAPQLRAQDNNTSSASTTPSPSDRSSATTEHPKKLTQDELKKKVTNVNKASKFIGMKVQNLQNENLGKVEDLAIDPESGKISYAVLGVGGFLGLNEKYIAVPLNALAPAPGDDYLVLDADKQRLQNATGFSKDRWPDLDTPAWSAQTGFAPAVTQDQDKNSRTASTSTTPKKAPRRDTAPSPTTSTPSSSSDTAAAAAAGTAGKSAQEQGSASEQSDRKHFSGKITQIDQNARTVQVKGDSGEKTFHIDTNAQITSGTDNDAKLTDLKTGVQAKVEYTEESGKTVAKALRTGDSGSSDDSKDQDKQ